MADAFVVQLSGNTTFDKTVPFRLRRGDGTWEWFEGQSTYIANISGHPYRLVGICLSIQEYKDCLLYTSLRNLQQPLPTCIFSAFLVLSLCNAGI